MKVLIKSARIFQSDHKSPVGKVDILIEKGIIKKIAKSIKVDSKTKVIESKDLSVSPGWFDMKVNFRDPGEEIKEDLESGAKAAAAGGFTGVLVMPTTDPPIQNKSDIEYIIKRSLLSPVDIYPAGALSKDMAGKDITEMFDMTKAGAVAFTDDKYPIADSGLMLRALQYAKNTESLIITYASDEGIVGNGMVNEGVHSTIAGFKGSPSLAEEIGVSRDIKLAEYAESKIHFSCISTSEAVKQIKMAKKSGHKVSCDIAAHNLVFDDSKIISYNTNFKVNPPLRSSADVNALRKAVKDGVIDVICSDHSPQDSESKDTEFDFASYGISGIETVYSSINTVLGLEKEPELLVKLLSSNPRKILNLPIPEIKEGEQANLTLFDNSIKWTFAESDMISKSHNSPFIGQEFKGKVIGVVNNSKLVLVKDLAKEKST